MRATVMVVAVAGLSVAYGCGGYELCTPTEQVLATDEQTPLGPSAEDLLGQVAGPHEAAFTYDSDPGKVGMCVALVRLVGDVTFFDLEPRPSAEEWMCRDYLTAAAEATFATDDGAFDELLVAHVQTDPDDTGEQLHFSMDGEDDHVQLVGGYEVPGVDSADCDTLAFSWTIDFRADGSAGRVGYCCRRAVGTTDDGETIMSATCDEVGSW